MNRDACVWGVVHNGYYCDRCTRKRCRDCHGKRKVQEKWLCYECVLRETRVDERPAQRKKSPSQTRQVVLEIMTMVRKNTRLNGEELAESIRTIFYDKEED